MVLQALSVAAVAACLVGIGAATDLKLTLLADTLPAAQGGRCMDGSMTGYYYREGVPGTFVIFMHGGGGCSNQGTCKKWAAQKGSSKDFARTQNGDHAGMAGDDCSTNPYFCNATGVIVPYCTGDNHLGNNTVASKATFGWIFDGHANFVAIIEELVHTRGLGNAKRILLTGNSAGGIGVFFNLDWLANRFPDADVKGAPTAGWFFPGALPGDLANIYPPSDFPHFYAGTHGNAFSQAGGSGEQFALFNARGILPASCVAAQKPDQWWACGSVHTLYPFIKTPLFVVENQFDTAQLYAADGHLPKQPTSGAETAATERYVAMYGEAMRNSTAQVLNDAPVTKKRVPDGLFHPSCFQHEVNITEQITAPGANGTAQSWPLVLGDWFFEQNALSQYHRLVERCSAGLPCNAWPPCKYGSSPSPPGPPPIPGGCAAQLAKDGCSKDKNTLLCQACATIHNTDLEAAGCTREEVHKLCDGAGPSPSPGPAPPSPGPPSPSPPPPPGPPSPPPAPPGPESCAACEKRVCPDEAGKGKACKDCVIANSDALEAAGCYVGGNGGRTAFCKTFCGV